MSASGQVIIQAGENATAVVPVDASGVLVDAEDYYRAFVDVALEAQSSILLSGWQFDRGVPLLRGADVRPGLDTRLLPFLNHLCERRPGLQIYVLAWDFHIILALEREWMQTLYFRWLTPENLHFKFDETESQSSSHHQKFAVIDRRVAFVGGIDLCEARWDDRRHLVHHPDRLSRGDPVKPYHDAQAYVAGCAVADALRDIFAERWNRSRGEPLDLPPCDAADQTDYRPRGGLPLPAREVALSRTDPDAAGAPIDEIRRLFTSAISAARALVYIETQYLSSHDICEALVARMHAAGDARLEIVVVVNPKAERLKEEVAVGLRQAKNLELLREASRQTGHALGIYYPGPEAGHEEAPATYVHTKLLVVDDRLLSVGSANFTNRSLGVDTELQATWETTAEGGAAHDRALARAIRRVRISLLAEHAGVTSVAAVRGLVRIAGLVSRLDAIAATPTARLRHVPGPAETEQKIMRVVDPEALPFDPDSP